MEENENYKEEEEKIDNSNTNNNENNNELQNDENSDELYKDHPSSTLTNNHPTYSEDILGEGNMYVTDPTLNKDGLSSYVTYMVQGNKVPDPLIRRFKDFYTLRTKLVERWPGIYIPRTPHRKVFSNKNKEIIDMRIEMINKFCSKISNIPHLFNSDEMSIFLKNDPNSIKELENLPKPSYEDLVFKYGNAFSDYDENFDFESVKNDQTNFYQKLKTSFPIVSKFLDRINKIKEQFSLNRTCLLNAFELISSYEKDWIGKFSKNDELIINNISNRKTGTSLSKFEIYAKGDDNTPFDNFYNKVQSHLLDIEASIEAFESFSKLCDENDKLKAKLKDVDDSIEKCKAVNKNPKLLNTLNTNKEQLEKKISDLTNVTQICLFQMKKEFENFRIGAIKDYYEQFAVLINDMKKDRNISDNIYKNMLGEPVMKEISIKKNK